MLCKNASFHGISAGRQQLPYEAEVFLAYNYGVPGQTEVGRPRCWGNPAEYNPDLRECRGCTFVASCRDNIVRLRNYPQGGYAPPGYPSAPPTYVSQAPVFTQP